MDSSDNHSQTHRRSSHYEPCEHPGHHPRPRTSLILALAADIRTVDGNHDLGAAALAEKLIELGWRK